MTKMVTISIIFDCGDEDNNIIFVTIFYIYIYNIFIGNCFLLSSSPYILYIEFFYRKLFFVSTACLFGSAEIYFFFVVVGAYRDPILTIGRINSWSWAFEVCGAGTCFAFASSFFWYLDSRRDVDYVPFEDQNELRL